MNFRKLAWLVIIVLAAVLAAGPALAKKNPMEAWKPKFDPKGAEYKMVVSNVSHPILIGVRAGFWIRDALWEKTKGKIYFDFRPFSQLGGEVEVLNMLQTGAIQGMACSSVASTNLGPRMGLVNLPFLVGNFAQLDKFVSSKELFQHFLDGMEHQGIMGVDISGYGQYGWASTKPIKNLDDAKKVKFRIAEAAVNQATYKAWGLNPVVMPWPDVPTALKQGVITGLDHTPAVCYITRKFEVAKNFTELKYAQGLFIWLLNKAWYNKLPADLQKILIDTIKEQCARARAETATQEADSIKEAQEKAGVSFFKLSDADMAVLKKEADAVHQKWADQIGADYLAKVQKLLGYK